MEVSALETESASASLAGLVKLAKTVSIITSPYIGVIKQHPFHTWYTSSIFFFIIVFAKIRRVRGKLAM